MPDRRANSLSKRKLLTSTLSEFRVVLALPLFFTMFGISMLLAFTGLEFVAAFLPGAGWNLVLSAIGQHPRFEPWVYTSAICSIFFLVFLAELIDAINTSRRIHSLIWGILTLAVLGPIAPVILVKSGWQEIEKYEFDYQKVEFTKKQGRLDRKLTFIGVNHVTEFRFLEKQIADVRALEREKNIFFYEGTNILRFLGDDDDNGDSGSGLNYGIPWYRFAVDIVFEPRFLLEKVTRKYKWHHVDLYFEDQEIFGIQPDQDPDQYFDEMQKERDKHLLREINLCECRRLTVIYGHAHLVELRPRLIKQGWVVKSDELN